MFWNLRRWKRFDGGGRSARTARCPRDVAALSLLTLLALMIRLPALRSLPIFGDEAIFLRLARLTHEDLGGYLWSSLQVAYPPIHTWLLALAWPLSRDPVLSGRLVSVLVGAFSIPIAAWTSLVVVDALDHGEAPDPARGRLTAVVCAVASTFCPFFVFSQRVARVDALFLLETILIVGLSVRLAMQKSHCSTMPVRGVGLGVLMGVTMLTRQAVSYPLWAIAPLAWVVVPRASRVPLRSLLCRVAIGVGISLVIWSPMLLAPGSPDPLTRVFFSAEMRPSLSGAARAALTLANLRLSAASFWTYLTPPLVIGALAGCGYISATGRLRLLGFLICWVAILLLPVACFASPFFPRYALAAAFPVVLIASRAIAATWLRIEPTMHSRAHRWILAALIAVAAFGWSICEVSLGEADWRKWQLLPVDRAQYVSGWAAGSASQEAAAFLSARAREQPITVLTPEFSGNPTDTVWLMLQSQPGIRLAYAFDALGGPLLKPAPGRPDRFWIGGDARKDSRLRPLVLSAGEPVYLVSMDPVATANGWRSALTLFKANDASIEPVAVFRNPAADDVRDSSSVIVLRVR